MRSRSPFAAVFCRSESIAAAAALVLLLTALPAHAVDPRAPFSRAARRHFTADDGLPWAVVDNVLQTRDGFLWMIVNGNGLVRFDGRNFQLIDGVRAKALAVSPEGDLWLGSREDLRRIPADALQPFDLSRAVTFHPGPGPASDIRCLRFGRDGTLWVGTTEGLFVYDTGKFSPVGPRVRTREIEQAANGHLLVVTLDGFLEMDGKSVVPLSGLEARLGVEPKGIFHVAEDSHGDLWYCTSLGVVRRSGDRWVKLPGYGPERHGGLRTYEDSAGNVWVAKAEGLFRAAGESLEPAIPRMEVRSLFGDRDGALWIGTNGDGLYRIKDAAVRMFTTADGLPNDVMMTVLSSHDGSIWAGANCGGLSHFDGTHFRTFAEKDGLLNSCVLSLAEDAGHDLWIGTWGGGAFRLHEGRFTQFLAGEIVSSVLAAGDGSIWLATRNGIVRLRDGSTRLFTAADGLRNTVNFKIVETRAGAILAGSWAGVDRLAGERFEAVPGIPKTLAIPMGEDRSGGLFVEVADEPAALRIEESRVDPVPELRQQSSVIETDSGELWFTGFGVHRVPAGSFARPRPRDEPLDDEGFGEADGLAAMEASAGVPNMARAGDGTLWVATARGLAMIDPRRLHATPDPPSLYMREVTVGRETRPAPRQLLLPAGTSHVEIDFSAVELSSPERIGMQYRLDGVDSEWLEAPPNPRAIYSNIPTGTHALRVRARNRSGIWDRRGIVYSIRQQPHFYQTGWFLASAIAVGLLLVGGAYGLRVRQVSKQIQARFDERLRERVRVARELHDTFLQTVQGSKLVADHALKDRDNHARLLGAVEQLAEWLGRATEEGRAALNSLRATATESSDLAEALRRAIDECRAESPVDATLSVTGDVKDIHPIVGDEIYRIGREAIRNACAHSGAGTLEVALEHDHDLTLRVRDDGVGMGPAVLARGKVGHFGLSGMRERADRIGGTLTVTSSPGSGTTLTLAVPGRLAYRGRRFE